MGELGDRYAPPAQRTNPATQRPDRTDASRISWSPAAPAISAAMPARRWPRAGYTPVAYDNLVYGHREAVRWGPLVEADLADRARLADDACASTSIAAVMHFAAFAYVGESMTKPELYFRNNVVNTLGAARRDAARRGATYRLLLDLRHLRHAGAHADHRGHAAAPGQSLRREQAHGRAGAPLVRRGAWAALRGAALFQCGRRRSRWRDRRGSRSRDPSHSAHPRCRARPPGADRHLRHRLSDAGRHGGARLYPCPAILPRRMSRRSAI